MIPIVLSQSQYPRFENDEKTYTNKNKNIPTLSSNLSQLLQRCLNDAGEDRLKRICGRPEIKIDIAKIRQNPLELTQDMAEKLLVGLLDIQKADLDELEPSLSIAQKYEKLIGFKSFQEFEKTFTAAQLNLDHFKIDKSKTSGKGLKGLAERVYIAVHHHFKVQEETDLKAAEIRDAEVLTSRLADREMQEGSILHLSDGYYHVEKVFVGGGAYVSLLRNLEGNKPPKLVCRGTALRPTATEGWKTGVNDILIEMGSWGTKSVWPLLSKYLRDNKIENIEVLGKSLGGAHAQELAVLIEGILNINIEKLVTFGSIGVGDEINELFKKEVLEKRKNPLIIEVIRNGGKTEDEVDYIPALGGAHLGEGADKDKCDVRIYYIQPGQDEVGLYPDEIDWKTLAKNIIRSLGTAHCRQTTLEDFRWVMLTTEKDIEKHIRKGKSQVNFIREIAVSLLDFYTAFLLNGQPFQSYYYSQKL